MQKIFEYHFMDAIAPISLAEKVTYFLPSENALNRIPASVLEGKTGQEIADVSLARHGVVVPSV